MISLEYILLMNTGVFSVFLLVLLSLTGKKKPDKGKREYLKSDLIKIKEQITDG